ncbi:MAG: hypothetical protein IJS17_03985, partial [Clostridia bacterium]|nr:hypothetical protein [Clostridia bacterium]
TDAAATGLRPFGTEDLTVDVTIAGPRYSTKISDITTDDFNIEAVVSNVTSVGEHELSLNYSVADKKASYTIKSISKQSVWVYFDNFTSEKVLPIDLLGVPETNLAQEGLYCEGVVLSQNSVTVSGATSQINSLGDSIQASYDSSGISFPLSKTVNFDVNLILQDSNGKRLNYITIVDGAEITGSIPVMEIKNVAASVSFKNVPKTSGNNMPNNISYVISPDSVDVAAASDVLSSMSTLDVGVVDFRNISPGANSFTFKSADITSAKIADDSITEFTVTIYAANVTTASMSVPVSCATLKNIPDGYRASLADETYCISNATFVGPSSTLENMAATDITVTVNVDSASEIKEGKIEAPATIVINQNGVWSYGEYTVSVNLEKI